MLRCVCRHWWAKVLWAIWPAWVWFTVMATGNHFWLDVVGGVAGRAGRRSALALRAATTASASPQPKPPPERCHGAPRPNVREPRSRRATRPARARSRRSRSTGLARTRVTPNALTRPASRSARRRSVLVWFEYRNELLFFWLGAALFVVGSILDILDGALARAGGKSTPFGALPRLDDRPRRRGLHARRDRATSSRATATTCASRSRSPRVAGSFLVSYTRARAEALGLQGRRRHRLPRRARRRDHRRPRARAVGRACRGRSSS